MIVSVLVWCNILCLLVVVFFNPTQIIQIRTLSLFVSLPLSVCVIWNGVTWEYKSQRSRSAPYKPFAPRDRASEEILHKEH